jgi:hypothetical protein
MHADEQILGDPEVVAENGYRSLSCWKSIAEK